jgi:glycosyltransferase involved in cell wall biosynthesis
VKLAFVTSYDARQRNSWNGCGYYQAKCLQDATVSVEYIGPLAEKYWKIRRAKELFYGRALKKVYTYNRDALLIRYYKRQISSELANLNADVVFSGISPGSQPVAYLDCKQPIVIWTDATIAGVIGWYSVFSNLCRETMRDAIANERSALERARLVLYSSDWAAQSAINHYALPASKIRVVPFGPILDCDRNTVDIAAMVDRRPTNKCKLLFVGGKWHGKGGDVAYRVTAALNESGLETELTIVGCRPSFENGVVPSFVKPLGYVSNKTKEGMERISDLFAESHFLILPSREDACPHVLAEANSFGVPCISTNVGGITTAIRDGLNGRTFPLDAPVTEHCAYISNLMARYTEYRNLALSSFNEYQSRLNWSVAGTTVRQLLREIA